MDKATAQRAKNRTIFFVNKSRNSKERSRMNMHLLSRKTMTDVSVEGRAT
jgi:hypothetical protein